MGLWTPVKYLQKIMAYITEYLEHTESFTIFFGEVNPFSRPMKQGLAVEFLLKEEMTQRN